MRNTLDLRQLVAVIAIAEHGSFSAAATHLHVSQPALSRTIRLAEEQLGAAIFVRGARRVSLTPPGAELLPVARRIVEEMADSMSRLSQFIDGHRGHVRVSYLPSLGPSLVVGAVADFCRRYPAVKFSLKNESAEAIFASIESCTADVGITVQPPPDGRFSFRLLHQDHFVFVCRKDDPIVAGRPAGGAVPWRALPGQPLIAAPSGSNTRRAIDEALMRVGLSIEPSHECSGDLMVLGEMVAEGLGATVLPHLAFRSIRHPALTSRPLGPPRGRRRIGLVTASGRTLSVAAKRFCEHIASFESPDDTRS
jgi:DNA-binding transcriptional LysR family regulator